MSITQFLTQLKQICFDDLDKENSRYDTELKLHKKECRRGAPFEVIE